VKCAISKAATIDGREIMAPEYSRRQKSASDAKGGKRTRTATVKQDPKARRGEILDAAAALFATSGLRTSLRDIADAVGILPGSLYHHFESKDAILIELTERYHTDLARIADIAVKNLDSPDAGQAANIVAFGSAIANCAVHHRAALQMSFYDLPTANPELRELAQRPPSAVRDTMLQILRAGMWSGFIRSDVDLPMLADRICDTMLQLGLDIVRHNSPVDRAAELSCRIILEGLASRSQSDSRLERSPAFAAADSVIQTWTRSGPDSPKDTTTRIVDAARAEFARKGHEVTTMRDIAGAAGLDAANVYRLIGSKDDLLAAIMKSYGEGVGAGWVAIMQSNSTPIEKLDALSWVDINALVHFHDEFRIQMAWMRQSPPDTPNPGWSFHTRLRQLKALLSEGIQSGELRVDSPSKEMLARCVLALLWMPESIVNAHGVRPALVHARDTTLRGVANRGR
jgi:AcrR family transcriptional regulator